MPDSPEFGKTIRAAAEALIGVGEAYKGDFTFSNSAFTREQLTAHLAAEEQATRAGRFAIQLNLTHLQPGVMPPRPEPLPSNSLLPATNESRRCFNPQRR